MRTYMSPKENRRIAVIFVLGFIFKFQIKNMERIPNVISTMANRDILHGDSVEAFPGEGGESDPEVGD